MSRLNDILRTANESSVQSVFRSCQIGDQTELTTVDRDIKRMASVEEMRVLFRQQQYHEIAGMFEHLNLDDLTSWELFWLTESTYTVRFPLYIYI